jgi:predicted RNase H-like nuclease
MAGQELPFPKRSWSGLLLRRRVLLGSGIQIPEDIGDAGIASADDVLDAGAAAWSARRKAAGEAERLPARADESDSGRVVAIWY